MSCLTQFDSAAGYDRREGHYLVRLQEGCDQSCNTHAAQEQERYEDSLDKAQEKYKWKVNNLARQKELMLIDP